MNRLMTLGQDLRWRRELIQRANLPRGRSLLLDLGGGTGDVGLTALRQNPAIVPIEIDFTIEMMLRGKTRPGAESLLWSAADVLAIPFDDNVFDAVVSGFLLRNVTDIDQVLSEQYRVLEHGGRIVTLDTTRPRENLFSPLIRFHMHTIIPFLGRLLTGEAEAYTYLPDSSEGFLPAEDLAACMSAAGFEEVRFRRLMFGTIAIHWGRK
ncbi:MAG: ubiquinone/menaquinone biosynthesis methyltransferase [Chloroflexota bacterium]|nr:ubiquinone/menaquinone biosynthesis methyltransferase [Chloroflexota bacterium]